MEECRNWTSKARVKTTYHGTEKTNYKLGKNHILCTPADHRSPYRRWTNYSNPCNPITTRAPDYNVFFWLGSLLRMDEINQTLGSGTRIQNHNVEIFGDKGWPPIHGCGVWIICPSIVGKDIFSWTLFSSVLPFKMWMTTVFSLHIKNKNVAIDKKVSRKRTRWHKNWV